jgi:hypothetical protein
MCISLGTVRAAIAAVAILACVGVGVWLGLRTSVRLGYIQETKIDRRTGWLVLWIVFVAAAAIALVYSLK